MPWRTRVWHACQHGKPPADRKPGERRPGDAPLVKTATASFGRCVCYCGVPSLILWLCGRGGYGRGEAAHCDLRRGRGLSVSAFARAVVELLRLMEHTMQVHAPPVAWTQRGALAGQQSGRHGPGRAVTRAAPVTLRRHSRRGASHALAWPRERFTWGPARSGSPFCHPLPGNSPTRRGWAHHVPAQLPRRVSHQVGRLVTASRA
jgi:hypothetical protein